MLPVTGKSLKFVDFSVVVQLIRRQMRTKISWTTISKSTNLRLASDCLLLTSSVALESARTLPSGFRDMVVSSCRTARIFLYQPQENVLQFHLLFTSLLPLTYSNTWLNDGKRCTVGWFNRIRTRDTVFLTFGLSYTQGTFPDQPLDNIFLQIGLCNFHNLVFMSNIFQGWHCKLQVCESHSATLIPGPDPIGPPVIYDIGVGGRVRWALLLLLCGDPNWSELIWIDPNWSLSWRNLLWDWSCSGAINYPPRGRW